MMKNLSSCLVAVIVLSAASARAGDLPYVGVQLTGSGNGGGTPLGIGTVAGVVPQAHFNVAGGQSGGPISNLVNAGGHPTPIGFSWTADDSWTTGTTANGPNGAGDPTLLSGEDKTRSTATYSLTGVPAGHYDLFIYTVNDVANEGASAITVGTTTGPSTLYNVDQTGTQWNASPSYVNGGSITSSTSLTPGNYVEFFNVSPVAGDLTFTHSFTGAIGSNTVSYNGFQLTQVTPEPSSFVLCGLGAAGLFLAVRRRRKT